jgi:ADP-ribose pyrophosphatase YjhB (NUDIX family)
VHIRVTGVLIDNGRILLLNQDTGAGRSWSLPGGKVEDGETLAGALVREMREETGLEVEPGRLLYVCDHLPGDGTAVVHLTFEARRTGGVAGQVTAGLDTRPIRGVEFVRLDGLASRGFGPRFAELATAGFPGAGSYMGAKASIGL